ncbi:MAG: Ldh family oxidoreductase [Planctomycetota bacterium]
MPMKVPFNALVNFGTRLLAAKGVPAKHARRAARAAVETEAAGVTTHGLIMFSYLNGMIPDPIRPDAEPRIVRDTGATALVDGNGALGQRAMAVAADLAVKKARRHGTALVSVRKSFWIGAAGTYLIPIARKGFFAWLSVQSCACKDTPPVGGRDARFSTNPIALAFPTGADPVVADFSTAAVSMGRVRRTAALGEKAAEKIFMDRAGRLTNDPRAVLDGGTILFTGGLNFGHKAYALSLWAEALTAMAGGDTNNPAAPQRQSFHLVVTDPRAFAGATAYHKEMKRFIAHVKSSRRLAGVSEIRLPGERGFRRFREALKTGVPVETPVLDRLNDLAATCGVKGISPR